MIVTCRTCNLEYDDARALTFCPHDPLGSDELLTRKDLAFKLFDSRKKYRIKGGSMAQPIAGSPLLEGTVTSIDFRGMVSLSGGSIWDVYDPADLEEVPS